MFDYFSKIIQDQKNLKYYYYISEINEIKGAISEAKNNLLKFHLPT